MKILFVDQSLTGHHVKYMDAVASLAEVTSSFVLPEAHYQSEKEHVIKPHSDASRTLGEYLKYMNQIYDIACQERVDIVHFLYGDYFYKFFGLGLKKFQKKFKLLATFHVVRLNFLKTFSLKRICRCLDCAVVHTEHICDILKNKGILNYAHVEYPNFTERSKLSAEEAKQKIGFQPDVPLIAALGGTRSDKGLDLLLDALRKVDTPFQLLIAGRELDITREQIEALSAPYRDKVHCILDFVSDEELRDCIAASDIIALPYRKVLNGASGPLGEGVFAGKLILATDYGSVGELVRTHHIGYLWDSDSIDSMVEVLNKGLKSLPFLYDAQASAYRRLMQVETFQNSYLKLYRKLITEASS